MRAVLYESERPIVGGYTLVIEDQFMGCNAKSAFMVHEVAVRWRVLAECLGWNVFRVAPITWMTYWGITPRWKWGKKVENDEFCRQIANHVSGKKLAKDEAAAWLMAGYWLALKESEVIDD
jgi:hypothetical protein